MEVKVIRTLRKNPTCSPESSSKMEAQPQVDPCAYILRGIVPVIIGVGSLGSHLSRKEKIISRDLTQSVAGIGIVSSVLSHDIPT